MLFLISVHHFVIQSQKRNSRQNDAAWCVFCFKNRHFLKLFIPNVSNLEASLELRHYKGRFGMAVDMRERNGEREQIQKP